MAGIEGIHYPDGDAGGFQRLRGLGVDRLHAHVGQLVGDIEIGVADRMDLAFADDHRVAGTEVVFLVDHRLRGIQQHCNLGEGHLRIAPVELPHDPFRSFGVAGGKADGFGWIERGEGVFDPGIDSPFLAVLPAAQIDIGRIVAEVLQDIGAVEGAVHLADGGEEFPRGQQHLGAVDIAGGNDIVHTLQDIDGKGDPFADEPVGGGHIETDAGKTAVQFAEPVLQADHRRLVFGVLLEALVDAGLSGLLMLQQFVGHSRISRNDIDPVVDIVFILEDDVVQDFPEAGHGSATDFLYAKLSFSHYLSPNFSA